MACQRYWTFVPTPLAAQVAQYQMSEKVDQRLAYVRVQFAYFENLLEMLPDRAFYVELLLQKDVLSSAQIEGNRATLADLWTPSSKGKANLDVDEVMSHIEAAHFALASLLDPKGLPLSLRLLTEAHAHLMACERGRGKASGAFRAHQNWIGDEGCTIQEATFVPPNPHDMKIALDDLERYMHSHDTLHPFLRAALIHYQFETIHSFTDGNGSIGRLLIWLFLMQEGVISAPYLPISSELLAHRETYLEHLNAVREHAALDDWFLFFLEALSDALDEARDFINHLEGRSAHDKTPITDEAKRERAYAYFQNKAHDEMKAP